MDLLALDLSRETPSPYLVALSRTTNARVRTCLLINHWQREGERKAFAASEVARRAEDRADTIRLVQNATTAFLGDEPPCKCPAPALSRYQRFVAAFLPAFLRTR